MPAEDVLLSSRVLSENAQLAHLALTLELEQNRNTIEELKGLYKRKEHDTQRLREERDALRERFQEAKRLLAENDSRTADLFRLRRDHERATASLTAEAEAARHELEGHQRALAEGKAQMESETKRGQVAGEECEIVAKNITELEGTLQELQKLLETERLAEQERVNAASALHRQQEVDHEREMRDALQRSQMCEDGRVEWERERARWEAERERIHRAEQERQHSLAEYYRAMMEHATEERHQLDRDRVDRDAQRQQWARERTRLLREESEARGRIAAHCEAKRLVEARHDAEMIELNAKVGQHHASILAQIKSDKVELEKRCREEVLSTTREAQIKAQRAQAGLLRQRRAAAQVLEHLNAHRALLHTFRTLRVFAAHRRALTNKQRRRAGQEERVAKLEARVVGPLRAHYYKKWLAMVQARNAHQQAIVRELQRRTECRILHRSIGLWFEWAGKARERRVRRLNLAQYLEAANRDRTLAREYFVMWRRWRIFKAEERAVEGTIGEVVAYYQNWSRERQQEFQKMEDDMRADRREAEQEVRVLRGELEKFNKSMDPHAVLAFGGGGGGVAPGPSSAALGSGYTPPPAAMVSQGLSQEMGLNGPPATTRGLRTPPMHVLNGGERM